MGPTLLTCDLLPATHFHLERASLEKYWPIKGAPCVVTSFDGFNAYLLIVDANTCYTFVFLTVSKAPPVRFWTIFSPSMVSLLVLAFSAWIKEVNYGVQLFFAMPLLSTVTTLNLQVRTLQIKMTKLNA
jgi:hypothetical protein